MESLLTELDMLFSSLADRTRLSIVLFLLDKKEATVDEISKKLEKSQSLISHHLSCLRNCGVVKVRKEGKFSYYSLSSDEVIELIKIAINHVRNHSQSILSCEVLEEEKGIKVKQ
ncbi:transcriptional regulator [Sulfolobus sp. A20]|uniref:ArsR/SmtB family transcription factor n=1 Tax=Sulfolobaceae TaxID=118883 RepID=UPI000846006D|nr:MULTISPECIES: metalloregulator ArsR/SmtB family transcription factor [unclassified Sulfolobus]TRM73650.1 ArsR family transcriptional regulator [Sulfolobus sp. E5]TRM75195.1 ArsR family transcriptional regulator [Sulfolobus sp. A20-N-F8]TRM79647.1 ArsR family transcriptional regulator [Sulfolobus sp. B5]TRM80209.1 ArsR family transcriptional regulator [Sulfolobus sp. D5]TRM88371.1 ArsR family transcriptional regulator [Sulfolobus sp. E3]TRM89348.1 ArsR family transcriptional regulator [Sulf